jgi:hypothetical protein
MQNSNGGNGAERPPAALTNNNQNQSSPASKPLPPPFHYMVLSQPVAMRRSVVSEFNRLLSAYLTLGPTDNPLQLIRELQVALRWMLRVERRILIRRALTSAQEHQQAYIETLKGWDGPGRQPREDFLFVEQHLDEGRDLFAGLRPSRPSGRSDHRK